MRNLFYWADQDHRQAQLTALRFCRQKIPPRQIRILCMLLSINLWTLLASDFRWLPSHPHRSFRRSGGWWMGCRISLISWGLKAPAVCSSKKNKAAEPFRVESQPPSRVSLTAWSGKVLSPPSNAASRPQHPKLSAWIWLRPSTLLCFYLSFPGRTWEVSHVRSPFSTGPFRLLLRLFALFSYFFPVSELIRGFIPAVSSAPLTEACWVICRLTSTTQQRQEGRESRRGKEEMQSGVGPLGSLESSGRNAGWKSCEQIRGGSRKGMEEVKLWRIRNGGALGETRRN